jgi:hypothetical protein
MNQIKSLKELVRIYKSISNLLEVGGSLDVITGLKVEASSIERQLGE